MWLPLPSLKSCLPFQPKVFSSRCEKPVPSPPTWAQQIPIKQGTEQHISPHHGLLCLEISKQLLPTKKKKNYPGSHASGGAGKDGLGVARPCWVLRKGPGEILQPSLPNPNSRGSPKA